MVSPRALDPVLIIGGYGVVGRRAVQVLRHLHPDLPIAIGGRNPDRGAALAKKVGGASCVTIDLECPDLGLPPQSAFSAVVMLLKDHIFYSMKYAQQHSIPYILCSEAVFEIGPIVGYFIQNPGAAPILLHSNWMIGTATLPALHYARAFRSIDAVRLAVKFDDQDDTGPAAAADWDRSTQALPSPLVRRDGKWLWLSTDEAPSSFEGVGGAETAGQALGVLDVVSLSAATGAASIRFDAASGETQSRRAGGAPSHETIIEIDGERLDGRTGSTRIELVHPAGASQMAAVGVAVGVERMLGLVGTAPGPGLYLPETIIGPDYMMAQLEQFGTQTRTIVGQETLP